MVCMQYPMRGMEPLRRMFRGREEGIVFVDNEKVFQDAVKSLGFEEYFCDLFAGDFGHCTKKGNKLLAENLANVLSKEFFGKWRRADR